MSPDLSREIGVQSLIFNACVAAPLSGVVAATPFSAIFQLSVMAKEERADLTFKMLRRISSILHTTGGTISMIVLDILALENRTIRSNLSDAFRRYPREKEEGQFLSELQHRIGKKGVITSKVIALHFSYLKEMQNSEYALVKEGISRLLSLAMAVAYVAARALDGLMSLLAIPLALVFLGRVGMFNAWALSSSGWLRVLADLNLCAMGVLNPHFASRCLDESSNYYLYQEEWEAIRVVRAASASVPVLQVGQETPRSEFLKKKNLIEKATRFVNRYPLNRAFDDEETIRNRVREHIVEIYDRKEYRHDPDSYVATWRKTRDESQDQWRIPEDPALEFFEAFLAGKLEDSPRSTST